MTDSTNIEQPATGAGRGTFATHDPLAPPAPSGPPELTGAQCLIKALEDVGVTTIFGYPGGQAIDIYNALYDSKVLRHVLVRHEQGATHAADGFARATGKVGTVLVTSGPGATNTVTGLSTAYMDSVPIVVICGQVPTHNLGSDAFQESDITGITLPVVKHSYLLHDAADIAKTIAEAYYIASTGRPGPVLVDIPSNLAKAQNVPYVFPREVKLASYKPTIKGNNKQIRQAVTALSQASRPVLYLGGGVIASGATDEVTKLAETLQIPAVVSLLGKSCFPETHPLCLGPVGMHGSYAANAALQQSDLIFCVGARFADRVTGKLDSFAPDAKVVHIDIDPAEISKNRNADVPIVGDAKTVLTTLNEWLDREHVRPRTTTWLKQIDEWRRTCPLCYEKSRGVIKPQAAIEMLDALTKDKDTIYVTEVGQHQMWAAQLLHSARPRGFISSGGAGTMGFGFPAAMGAQLAYPKSRVVCITGDGSLQMCIQEMATIREQDLPVKVLLLDNGVLGMVHQWQDLFYDQRYSQTVFSSNPDFVRLAEAYGWEALRAERPSELEGAMKTWLASKRPSLLQVIVPASENVFPMVPAGGAISEPIGVVHFDKNGKPQGSQKASAASAVEAAASSANEKTAAAKPAAKSGGSGAAKSGSKSGAKSGGSKSGGSKSGGSKSGKEA